MDDELESESDNEEVCDNVEYTELTIQMAFDIFSYLSQRTSFDSDSAVRT